MQNSQVQIKKINNRYKKLLDSIGSTIHRARNNASRAINTELVKSNWDIGKEIIEYEQQGHERAEYGSELLIKLSKDLTQQYGSGFGRRNILDMRRFYLTFQKWQTVSAKLSWSHYIELISVSDAAAREFYKNHSINENLSVRELQREIDSSLFERLALSKNKKEVMRLSKKGQEVSDTMIPIKYPYILDFLKIPNNKKNSEKVFEQKIIDNLQLFLLELGKGFTFVGRQYRISIRNTHYYIDLVFYHRILKCFVLIDLKTRKVDHSDIGQMNLYLNYLKAEECAIDDKEPIGIILSAEKDEVLVEYAMGGLSNKIFVSKYQLHLPDKKVLQKKVKSLIGDNKPGLKTAKKNNI